MTPSGVTPAARPRRVAFRIPSQPIVDPGDSFRCSTAAAATTALHTRPSELPLLLCHDLDRQGQPGRAIAYAQKQPPAAVESTRLLCQGLRARGSSVSALSRWTTCTNDRCRSSAPARRARSSSPAGVTGTEHGRSLIDPSASVTRHGRFRGRGTAASLWADPCHVLFRRRRSSDCWPARSTGQLVRRPERVWRAALGGSSAAAPRSAQSASGMPILIAEETKRADLTQLRDFDRRYAFAELTLRRLDVPVLVARDELGRQVGAGSRQPPSDCRTRGSLRARGRRLFGGAGAVGE